MTKEPINVNISVDTKNAFWNQTTLACELLFETADFHRKITDLKATIEELTSFERELFFHEHPLHLAAKISEVNSISDTQVKTFFQLVEEKRKIHNLTTKLEELTIQDAVELTKALEAEKVSRKKNISGSDTKKRIGEKKMFSLLLRSFEDNEDTIKVIREITRLSQKEVKVLINKPNAKIYSSLSEIKAQKIKQDLEEAGIVVKLMIAEA